MKGLIKNKKGLSAVVTNLIIILLVIVAVGVVWVVVSNLINETSGGINLGKITLGMEIKKVVVDGTNVDVQVERKSGEGNLSGIKFLVYDSEGNSQAFEVATTMGELSTKTFTLEGYNLNGVVRVEIAPILTLDDGKQKVQDVVNEYDLSEYQGISGNIQSPIEAYAIFDGVDDYVNISDDSSLDFGTGDFSISLWVYSKGYSNKGSVFNSILSKGQLTSSSSGFYGFFFTSDNIPKFFVDDDGTYASSGSVALGTNWKHLVGVREGGTLKIYLDGIKGTDSTNPNLVDNANKLIIGDDGGGSRYFNGSIDELMIFNRALTQAEITEIYNLNRVGSSNTNGLVAYYTFDDLTAKDNSGNENDGTLENGAEIVSE